MSFAVASDEPCAVCGIEYGAHRDKNVSVGSAVRPDGAHAWSLFRVRAVPYVPGGEFHAPLGAEAIPSTTQTSSQRAAASGDANPNRPRSTTRR